MNDERLASHPEELLDRARLGSLSILESRVLKEHLAICPSCAIQFRIRSVTEEGGHDDGLDHDNALVEQLAIDNVLCRLSWERSAPLAGPFTVLRRRLQWAAAILFFSVTGAAATWWSAHHLVPRATIVAATHASRSGSTVEHPERPPAKNQATPTARW